MRPEHATVRPHCFPTLSVAGAVRNLVIVFGDQLDPHAAALAGLDPSTDAVLMMEVAGESTHIPSHKQRTTLFLAAMRHFAMELRRRGFRVQYVRLDDPVNTHSLHGEIGRAAKMLKPAALICTRPGEWRVERAVDEAAATAGLPVHMLPDGHFLVGDAEFAAWMAGRKQPVMEHFYRWQRRRLGILVEPNGAPMGGQWNYDSQNRGALRRAPRAPQPYAPSPDALTQEVIKLVERHFADHPGALNHFRWPVTRTQARRALDDFIRNRLPYFGTYQDAMWAGEPFLYHALLSPALNLKLLNPRECVAAALAAYECAAAPLNCVEGFVRQIIGWREFIHGIYWYAGPEYGARNALDQHGTLPEFYWTGKTDMVCLRECLGQVLADGYGHHIQRLMVTGNFALLAGVDPRQISDWYLGMYVDAVDWVTLPNTLGMAMHADGGVVGTKPYVASGRYIARMSNYCATCRFEPADRAGAAACPFTTFYWDFLLRHARRFRSNRRMALMLKSVDGMAPAERRAIRARAEQLRAALGVGVSSRSATGEA